MNNFSHKLQLFVVPNSHRGMFFFFWHRYETTCLWATLTHTRTPRLEVTVGHCRLFLRLCFLVVFLWFLWSLRAHFCLNFKFLFRPSIWLVVRVVVVVCVCPRGSSVRSQWTRAMPDHPAGSDSNIPPESFIRTSLMRIFFSTDQAPEYIRIKLKLGAWIQAHTCFQYAAALRTTHSQRIRIYCNGIAEWFCTLCSFNLNHVQHVESKHFVGVWRVLLCLLWLILESLEILRKSLCIRVTSSANETNIPHDRTRLERFGRFCSSGRIRALKPNWTGKPAKYWNPYGSSIRSLCTRHTHTHTDT